MEKKGIKKFKVTLSKILIFFLMAFFIGILVHPPWNYLRDKVDIVLNRPPAHFRSARETVKNMHDDSALKKLHAEALRDKPRKRKGYKYRSTIVPKDWHITVSGTIEKGASYKVVVTYYAEKKSRFCQKNFGIVLPAPMPGSGTPFQKSKSYTYHPEIDNGQHSIKIPLNEKRPDWGCLYAPWYVRIFLQDAEDRKYMADLFVMPHLFQYGTSYRNQDKRQRGKSTQGVIDAKCYRRGNRYRADHHQVCAQEPIGSARYQYIRITQRMLLKNIVWELNIDIISDEEQQELFAMWADAEERRNIKKR